MDTLTIILYLIGAIITWIIFYYVVKAAIRNGIKEAHADKETQALIENRMPERPANGTQQMRRLQEQYDKGEITFEKFKSQWNEPIRQLI